MEDNRFYLCMFPETCIGLINGASVLSLSMKDFRRAAIARFSDGQISKTDHVFASGVHRSRMEVTYTERKQNIFPKR